MPPHIVKLRVTSRTSQDIIELIHDTKTLNNAQMLLTVNTADASSGTFDILIERENMCVTACGVNMLIQVMNSLMLNNLHWTFCMISVMLSS